MLNGINEMHMLGMTPVARSQLNVSPYCYMYSTVIPGIVIKILLDVTGSNSPSITQSSQYAKNSGLYIGIIIIPSHNDFYFILFYPFAAYPMLS